MPDQSAAVSKSAEAASGTQDRHFLDEILAITGPAGLIDDPRAMQPYVSDWRGTYSGAARCVVRPASTQETAAVVALCARLGIRMVPQGGNTGMCGGASPGNAGDEVLINMSRMNRILQVDTANNTLTAEAGCILQHIKDAADQADRLYPLAFGAQGSCEIGGNLSTNAGGVNVLKYGNARNSVLGLEVVLPDGTVLDTLKSLRKDNCGYDLKHLFIGAEGTLGIVTRVVLQLYPKTKVSATAWVAIDDPAAAVALLGRLRDHVGERVTGFELVSRPMLDLVLSHRPGDRDPLDRPHPWYVLLEMSDTLTLDLADLAQGFLASEIAAGRVRDAMIASSIAQAKALWALRENVTEVQRAEGASIKHDIAIPVPAIAAFLEQADRVVTTMYPGARIIAFGHMGDGNVHYNVLQPVGADKASFTQRMLAVTSGIHDIAFAMGGSISAEHGLGKLKSNAVFARKDAVEIKLMRAIKDAIDPLDLMNRGKVFPA